MTGEPEVVLELYLDDDGTIRMIADSEGVAAAFAARLSPDATIARASDVEPVALNAWAADMARVGGPIIGTYGTRQEAIDAEIAWLRANL